MSTLSPGSLGDESDVDVDADAGPSCVVLGVVCSRQEKCVSLELGAGWKEGKNTPAGERQTGVDVPSPTAT